MHPVLGLFRRNAWATEELLRFGAGLPPEILRRSDPDVYGSIEASFNHIVGAEERYLSRLDGGAPGEDGTLSLNDLAEPARLCAERWEALLRSDVDGDRVREHSSRDGRSFRMADWLGFVQAVHHGDDHRTQINTLLSRQGIEPPDLDGWAFGRQADGNGGEVSPGAAALLDRFFGHHAWATHELMRSYVRLDDSQRQLSAAGTYGSIADTLSHLHTSDATYRARLDAIDWPAYLASGPDFEAAIPRRGGTVPAWVVAVQAIHHGNDHRTHVGTVTLAKGLAGPDLDVWSYCEAVGAFSEL